MQVKNEDPRAVSGGCGLDLSESRDHWGGAEGWPVGQVVGDEVDWGPAAGVGMWIGQLGGGESKTESNSRAALSRAVGLQDLRKIYYVQSLGWLGRAVGDIVNHFEICEEFALWGVCFCPQGASLQVLFPKLCKSAFSSGVSYPYR